MKRKKLTFIMLVAFALIVTDLTAIADAVRIHKPVEIEKVKKLKKIGQNIGGLKKALDPKEIDKLTDLSPQTRKFLKGQQALMTFLLERLSNEVK